MVYAKYYPGKSTRPTIVRIQRHITRDVKGVQCVEENRYPFRFWPLTGEWIRTREGFVKKSNLFELRSTRIRYRNKPSHDEVFNSEGIFIHRDMVTVELPTYVMETLSGN